MFDPVDGTLEFFGDRVPEDVARSWGRRAGDEQVIGQAELAPMVLAMRLWQGVLVDRDVLAFVDNDSAKDAAVRGYNPSLPSAFLVAELWRCIAAAGARPWFERVAGPSNPADGPSRLDFAAVIRRGGRRRELGGELWACVRAGPIAPVPRGGP